MSFISEFTSDICHIRGEANNVADTLSRINALNSVPEIDYVKFAAAQSSCTSLDTFLSTASTSSDLRLTEIRMGEVVVTCDTSEGRPRPLIPLLWRKNIFDTVYSLSHPGPLPSTKAIFSCFVWPLMKRDIWEWCRTCHACQVAKNTLHTRAPLHH